MKNEINISDLNNLLKSEEFQEDLNSISSFSANIRQKDPILTSIAKYLQRQNQSVILDWKEHDMKINQTFLDMNVYYEEELPEKLGNIFRKYKKNINLLLDELDMAMKRDEKLFWQLALPMLRKVFQKEPEYFLLVIVSRDVMNVSPEILEMIYNSQECLEYNKEYGINNVDMLNMIDDFYNEVQKKKPYNHEHIKINTNTLFPSSYHSK